MSHSFDFLFNLRLSTWLHPPGPVLLIYCTVDKFFLFVFVTCQTKLQSGVKPYLTLNFKTGLLSCMVSVVSSRSTTTAKLNIQSAMYPHLLLHSVVFSGKVSKPQHALGPLLFWCSLIQPFSLCLCCVFEFDLWFREQAQMNSPPQIKDEWCVFPIGAEGTKTSCGDLSFKQSSGNVAVVAGQSKYSVLTGKHYIDTIWTQLPPAAFFLSLFMGTFSGKVMQEHQ